MPLILWLVIFPPKFEFGGKDDLIYYIRRKYPVGIMAPIIDIDFIMYFAL
jgi:hypothetical protein